MNTSRKVVVGAVVVTGLVLVAFTAMGYEKAEPEGPKPQPQPQPQPPQPKPLPQPSKPPLLNPEQEKRLQQLCESIECGCSDSFMSALRGYLEGLYAKGPTAAYYAAVDAELKHLESLGSARCDWDAADQLHYFADPEEWWASIMSLISRGMNSKDTLEVGWVVRQLMNHTQLPETASVRSRFNTLYASWATSRCSTWNANMANAINSKNPNYAQGVINQAANEMGNALNQVGGLAPSTDSKLQGCLQTIISKASNANWQP